MNKWIAIPIIGVLAVGAIVLGVFYFQETDKLKDAQSQISTLQGNISTLQTELADTQAEVLALESNVSVLEARMSPELNLSPPLRLMD